MKKQNKSVNKSTDKKTTNPNNLTIFEQELLETLRTVRGYKLATEANIVSILFKAPETILHYDLKLEDFSNNIWKVYFTIAYDILCVEKKQMLDDITIGLYLEKHLNLKAKYHEYGGYETIEKAKEYVKIENMQGYVKEMKKWNVIIKMLKMKFPVYDRLKEFVDMTAEEIYKEYEAKLNHVFLNVDSDIKSYCVTEGLDELINDMHTGKNVGLPLHSSPILNQTMGGGKLGNIYMLGAGSGVGKTTTALQWLLPSILEHNEKICLIINEEDQTKIQKELFIWIINNVFKKELKKYVLRDGKFNDATMALLKRAAEWLKEKRDRKNITIIPLERYTTQTAIKIIKKYANMGVKYFLLDTLKPSSDSKSEVVWLEMQRAMVEFYDVIKPQSKNVCLWVNYQLGKASIKQRYYTNDAVGMGKSIIDVCSVNLMIRNPFDDEFEGGKHELSCFKLEGINKQTRLPFKLDKKKKYVIIFIPKNRFGETQAYQIVAEHNLSTNVYHEIGICNVPMDW